MFLQSLQEEHNRTLENLRKTKKTEEEYQVDLQKTIHELSDVKEQLVLSKEDKERMNKHIEKLTSDLKVYLIIYLVNKNE